MEIAKKRGNPELTKILPDKQKEIDALESSMSNQTDTQIEFNSIHEDP